MELKKVAIIAGHRGKGTGAVGIIDEGEETILLRDKIEDFLCMKYNIVPIVDNEKLTLNEVVSKLRTLLKKNDICIDIHFNAFANENANGAEVLIPRGATQDENDLAADLLKILVDCGIKSRGVKDESSGQHGKLAMLSGFDCCNVLVEVCFITNKNDVATYLKTRDLIAEKIADLIYKKIKV